MRPRRSFRLARTGRCPSRESLPSPRRHGIGQGPARADRPRPRRWASRSRRRSSTATTRARSRSPGTVRLRRAERQVEQVWSAIVRSAKRRRRTSGITFVTIAERPAFFSRAYSARSSEMGGYGDRDPGDHLARHLAREEATFPQRVAGRARRRRDHRLLGPVPRAGRWGERRTDSRSCGTTGDGRPGDRAQARRSSPGRAGTAYREV